jgi:hypothetical protein
MACSDSGRSEEAEEVEEVGKKEAYRAYFPNMDKNDRPRTRLASCWVDQGGVFGCAEFVYGG